MNRPNVVIIMTDQQRADLSKREGFPLDTTPFLDHLAREGTWFNRAYTAVPICVAARISFITGRFPNATRVKSNHNVNDACYIKDIFDVFKSQGYKTALIGKNHTYITEDRVDRWYHANHNGMNEGHRNSEEAAFDKYLQSLSMRSDTKPTPFPLECQLPYRCVSESIDWINSLKEEPFFAWVSFPEPHNPYQVPEPYFSLFPPEKLPATQTSTTDLEKKSYKWHFSKNLGEHIFADYNERVPRERSSYLGMLRLIDDQVARLVKFLEEKKLIDNTILLFLSDHGDFVGEYGLMRKGPEMPEVLMRIPFLFKGPGIKANVDPSSAHVSIVDIFPTLCEAIGVDIPEGVQGRSLWPLLTGKDYPEKEFQSIYAEQGFGGLHYTKDDKLDPVEEGCVTFKGKGIDCLNSWTQSGTMRMVRKGDWKLVFDMMGKGELYHLKTDPFELENLYEDPSHSIKKTEMLEELITWNLRMQDPLPLPRKRYVFKKDPRNYWTPYQA
jgi:arylsulfatase A-like enzyme